MHNFHLWFLMSEFFLKIKICPQFSDTCMNQNKEQVEEKPLQSAGTSMHIVDSQIIYFFIKLQWCRSMEVCLVLESHPS